MNTQMILDYLTQLSANNNREWYHTHKAEYQAANAQFEELIQALMLRIGEFDSSILGHAPKELTLSWCGTPDSAMTSLLTTPHSGRTFRPWESCPFQWAII